MSEKIKRLIDLKKGDIVFEKGYIELEVLEDAYLSGTVEIRGETRNQYKAKVRTKLGDVIELLQTEGLEYYGGYYTIENLYK